MPVAFSYVRYSSLRQAHGDSLRRQTAMVAEWLKHHPEYVLSADDAYQDLGRSGFSGAHLDNAFGRLRAAVSTGIIKPGDCILIEAIDRAGRLAPSIMLNLLTEIVNAGVSLISLDDGITYDSDPYKSNNLFLLVAKVQQAYQFSDALSRRVKSAYERKRETARAGEATGRRAPIWIKTEYPNGKKAQPVVSLREDLAPLVAQAFQDYADGLGERRIHHRLRDQHPELAKLSTTSLKRWMRNPTAIGNWNDIPDVYPAVVSKELWYRVQKRLNQKSKPKSAASNHLLVGLVKCAKCRANFHTHVTPDNAAMKCGQRHRLGDQGCSNKKSLPMAVLDFIRSQTTYKALQRASLSRNLTTSEKRALEIEGELAELNRQAATAAEGAVKYGMSAFGPALDRITAQIGVLEDEKLTLVSKAAPSTEGEMIDLQEELLDVDEMRLNALLQEAEYVMWCDDRTITIEEPSIEFSADRQVITYLGKDRVRGVFRITWNGARIDLPDLLSAPQRAELEQHMTQEARYKSGELERTVMRYNSETGDMDHVSGPPLKS
ncbi:recombinase family protein [Pseudomonas syringae]|uniref:recombinase family protein n=1 Tax=Pseudomonas syringae TaxID=317 RepID=UPI0011D0DB56|nr:recombinase family protein [Pseudomonas syringae]